jgi:monoterpene epsilon-lactone hydrolase
MRKQRADPDHWVELNLAWAGERWQMCNRWMAALAMLFSMSVMAGHSGCARAQTRSASKTPKVLVEANGTVHVPRQVVPVSTYLSPQAKAYLAQHLMEMQEPKLLVQVHGVPVFMEPFLQRDHKLFHVDRKEETIGGVDVYAYTPANGISAENRNRVLINLHGGGFSGCWPGCAELESIPIASLMRVKVVTVNYRQGPKYKFPAASEDVASVYAALLRTYKPENIGIYGCSAGGALTAMSVAWFATHHLPEPGAIGIYCASAGGFGGDSSYFALPIGESRMPNPHGIKRKGLSYFSNVSMEDPMVSPVEDPKILAKFPPTLIITGTRDFALSGALYTHEQLVKAGVDAELHVWEGLFHGFFYNADVPESQDAFRVMIQFFDRHLGSD